MSVTDVNDFIVNSRHVTDSGNIGHWCVKVAWS